MNLFTTKQKDGESLQDYTKRFRIARDVFESHIGGPMILTKIVEAMPDFSTDPEKCKKQAWERHLAFIYLRNSDQSKYGSILKGLNTQQSLNNDQYPKTVVSANNVLSSHQFDNAKSKTRPSPTHKDRENNNNRDEDNASDTKEEEEFTLSFTQLEGKCYCCGKPGHRSPDCRSKDKIPKEEWAINKTAEKVSHLQASENANNATTATSDESNMNGSTTNGWAGAHINFYQAGMMRNWILLDNQSNTTIFCNCDMVSNIRETNETLNLTTNAGVLTTKLKADVHGWGEVWFSDEAVTNIFSYAHMKDRHQITYDGSKEDAFIVHLPDKQVKFHHENDIYVFKPPHFAKSSTRNNKCVQFNVNSLEENKTFYTERQFICTC
jgi:hypothetical protein